MILKLVWRNIWRNKRRTLITMASVTFAVMLAVTMKSLQKGVFDHLVKNLVNFYSGYMQVHKAGYHDEQILDNSFDFSDSLIQSITQNKNVTGIVARIESFALASSETSTHGCLLVGTQTENENSLTGLKSKIASGKYFSTDANEAIVSEGLAAKLKLSVNDTIVLLGQGYQGNSAAGKYPISAIVRYGSPQLNEALIFLPLKAAQNFFSAENKITTIAISISSATVLDNTANEIKTAIGNASELLTWKEIMPDIEGHIRSDNQNFYIFIGMLYLLIAFGVFGTAIMMLAERRYELGMLMAVGMKRINLALMLVSETILISVFGTLIGFLISFPIVKYFDLHPIKLGGKMAEAYKIFGFEALWPAVIDINIFITQSIIVLCLSLLIGLFPLVKVQRMEAVTAMKR
jgi:ABC-type lipoprotein release transport system permease subunit